MRLDLPHYLPDDDFEHDETPGSTACPCNPSVCTMGWYGSAIVHRHMDHPLEFPNTFPEDWA